MYNIVRTLHIIIILALQRILHPRTSHNTHIVNALTKLGPSFIKFGQALSVRPDIVGEDRATALASLQDKVPPFAYEKAKQIIEKTHHKTIDQLFKSFDEQSVAAASIAQVHKAITQDGRVIAIKILRPKIANSFKRDIRLFYQIAKFLNRFQRFQRLRLIEVVQLFEDTVKKELDLRLEAAAASKLQENCIKDDGIYIPKVHWDLTSEQILALEWIDGTPIGDKQTLQDQGHDLRKISENLTINFLNQAYRDGFFHADLHPGNLFVKENGQIAPVDFGIMGQLDQENRIYVAEILRGFIIGDYDHVAKIHFNAGYIPHNQSQEDFALACRAIGEPIMGLPANEVSIGKLLALLFKVTEDFKMQTQPQLILLQKTMILVEGVGQSLYPQTNLWQQAESWIKDWAQDNLSAKAKAKQSLQEASHLLQDLPRKLKKLDKFLETIK